MSFAKHDKRVKFIYYGDSYDIELGLFKLLNTNCDKSIRSNL